ncbi:hypothetical protein NCC49_000141 [Naganishia albida]|nr:hypothetical protein NCC49_000141 [Naganishia albida]
MTDCQLLEGFDMYWELFNIAPYCVLSFKFSRTDMAFKDANQQATFALLPLQMEKLYQSLRYSAKLDWLWTRGTSTRDVASATHWLFTLATALPMSNHTVNQITLQNSNRLTEILDGSATSPVFLATRSGLSIVTGPETSAARSWQGFDVSAPNEQKIWTERNLVGGAKDDTYLIYNREQGRLPISPAPQDCDWRQVIVTNGTTKIYPFAT